MSLPLGLQSEVWSRAFWLGRDTVECYERMFSKCNSLSEVWFWLRSWLVSSLLCWLRDCWLEHRLHPRPRFLRLRRHPAWSKVKMPVR